MIVNDEKTWSADILAFLDANIDVFLGWEMQDAPPPANRIVTPSEFDSTHASFRAVLEGKKLIGYHCTRLTNAEIESIKTYGLAPQNGDLLLNRIDALVFSGEISQEIADRLKIEHSADDEYRRGMIWFCFFPPVLDAYGVQRFFRSWGGEALYAEHEEDPVTGEVLQSIGMPCVIEALVPVTGNPHNYLERKLIHQYLKNRGLGIAECTEHEGYALSAIPTNDILQIHKFNDKGFYSLTGYNGE